MPAATARTAISRTTNRWPTSPAPTCSSAPGEKTPAFVRFSTVAGSKGSADLARDVRGFAVKLYTKEGNWDIVGNNIPVFFIQDAIKFPDIIHAAKQEPDRGFPQAQTAHDNFWDFISLTPGKHAHGACGSCRTARSRARSASWKGSASTPSGWSMPRANRPSSSSTGSRSSGMQSVVWNEAVKINGADPDFHRRDLWDAIQSGDFPEWELGLQLFDEEFADKFDFDVLDATKIIPEEEVPVRRVGRLVLDRMRRQFLRRDRAGRVHARRTSSPGIDFTNDPLLQGRNFSYLDTQLKRLGSPNFTHLPINAPKCPFHHFQQDGHMAMRQSEGPRELRAQFLGRRGGRTAGVAGQGLPLLPAAEEGPKLRIRSETFADHYSQARQFYISQTAIEQRPYRTRLDLRAEQGRDAGDPRAHGLASAERRRRAGEKGGRRAAPEGTAETGRAGATSVMDLKPSPALSIVANAPGTFKGRKLGVLVSDGVDAELLKAVQAAFKQEGAMVKLVAPMVGGVEASDGSWIEADEKIDGGPSVVFDAVAMLLSDAGAQLLAEEATARDFVADAFAHCKFIGHSAAAMPLLEKAGIAASRDSGVIALGGPADVTRFLEACRQLRLWQREAVVKRV